MAVFPKWHPVKDLKTVLSIHDDPLAVDLVSVSAVTVECYVSTWARFPLALNCIPLDIYTRIETAGFSSRKAFDCQGSFAASVL